MPSSCLGIFFFLSTFISFSQTCSEQFHKHVKKARKCSTLKDLSPGLGMSGGIPSAGSCWVPRLVKELRLGYWSQPANTGVGPSVMLAVV